MASSIFTFVGNTHNKDGHECIASHEHRQAIDHRYTREPRYGRAIRKMLEGWAEYAEATQVEFGSRIGDDGVLGPAWGNIGEALKTLLNGPLGGWDAGSLWHNIAETLEANGIEVEP